MVNSAIGLLRSMDTIKKVYLYITYKTELLLFTHIDFPEAGIQVPGGTVEIGEEIRKAVIREACEETGLEGFHLVRKLGTVHRVLNEFGVNAIHERHYFHLKVSVYPGDTWVSYEDKPSDGSEGSITLRFYWIKLDQIPALAGGLDKMLPELRQSLI